MVSDTVKDTQDAIDVAVKVAEEQPAQRDIVKLSNGIVLRCKAVPIMTLRYASMSIPKPTPPVVLNPDKNREEVWEGDPNYQDELLDWQAKVNDAGFNVMLMLGTEIESIPEGIQKPEDNGWLESLEATGMSVNINTKAARYLSWLRFYAVASPKDYISVSEAVVRKSGLADEDVQASMSSFRGGEDGGTNSKSDSKKHSKDRNNLPSANGGPGSGS